MVAGVIAFIVVCVYMKIYGELGSALYIYPCLMLGLIAFAALLLKMVSAFVGKSDLAEARKKDQEEDRKWEVSQQEKLAAKRAALQKAQQQREIHLKNAKQMNLVNEMHLNKAGIIWMMDAIKAGRASSAAEASNMYGNKVSDEIMAKWKVEQAAQRDRDAKQQQINDMLNQFTDDVNDIMYKKKMQRLKEKELETLEEIEKSLRR